MIVTYSILAYLTNFRVYSVVWTYVKIALYSLHSTENTSGKEGPKNIEKSYAK